MVMMPSFPNFTDYEFHQCSPSCSIDDMDISFMNRLQTARDIAGIPFCINSAFRTSDHDKKRGRSGTGYHTLGRAVDISCIDSRRRGIIVNSLIKAGFRGIGVANTFIHVDDRPDFCLFLY